MKDLNLDAVSETLFIPLYALALESQTQQPIVRDEEIVNLTEQLNQAFLNEDAPIFRRLARGRLPDLLVTSLALRVRRYDRYVRDFLERTPDGIVVNLGCGLDNRRSRVDNGQVRWYDLDLPGVIALRRRFFDETERFHFISSSVLDFEWLDELPDEPGRRFLFIAEGLFMYLPQDDVRMLVTTLFERKEGAELVAEVAHSKIVRIMNSRFGRGKFRRQFGLSQDVVYQCGLDGGTEIESWAPGLKLLDEWTYFDEAEPKLRWLRLFGLSNFCRHVQWTVHYRLGEVSKS